MRSNSWETCCRQVYCFCLVHKATAASLIYLCTGCLQRHVQMLARILLKMSQSSAACMGLTFPSVDAAQSDMPACKDVVGSEAEVSFSWFKLRQIKLPVLFRGRCSLDRLIDISVRGWSPYNFHKYQTKPSGSCQETIRKMTHFARSQLHIYSQVITTLSLIDASWTHVSPQSTFVQPVG